MTQKSESVREAEQRPRTEDHAIKFLLRLKATLPELDENTGGEILRGLMDSLDEFAKSTIFGLAQEAEQEAVDHAFESKLITSRSDFCLRVAAWLREKAR